MSFLLCHECFTWVLPSYGRCPECHCGIDPGTPDPHLEYLGNAIGPVLRAVGHVEVHRKLLPQRGMLYATCRGLCFIPHDVEYRRQLVEVECGSTLLWSIASFVWGPLMLVLPFLKAKQWRERQLPCYLPRKLRGDNGVDLAEELLSGPGVFFIPLRDVQSFSRRRGWWRVERRHARPVDFRAEYDPRQLQLAIDNLRELDVWRDAVA